MVTGANAGLATQQFNALSQRIVVPSLPPSIQTSVQKAVSNGAFFMHQNAVLLPPPAGLFSNWSTPVSVHRMGQILCAQSYPACPFPVLGNGNEHVPASCSYIDSQGHSSAHAQRKVREGADSDGSDDNQSQCSTASYDGSQRSKSNVERPKLLHRSAEVSHPAYNVAGGLSNSDALNHEKRNAQDIKKRTWKVLLTPEQACEVNFVIVFAVCSNTRARRRF